MASFDEGASQADAPPTIPLHLTMPDGTQRTITVSSDFRALSPEQQAETVDQIVAHAPVSDTSFSSALHYGLATPFRTLADTADVAGANPEVAGTLRSVAGSIGAPSSYDPATPHIGQEIAQGNYGEALSYVPRATLEGMGVLGGELGLAAVGREYGGPVGAIGAPLAGAAAMAYGPNVKARAASAGRQQPTTEDYLGAIPGTAVEAGLQTLGTGLVPGARGAIEALPGALKPAARVGLEAGANAGADIAAQQASGQEVDPYEAAGAAAQGAGIRGATEVAGGAQSLVRGAGNSIARIGLPDMTPDEQQSIVRVVGDINQARQDAARVTGREPSDTELANNVKKTYQGQITALARDAVSNGFLDPDDYRAFFTPAFEQAARHNNVLTDGDGTAFGQLINAVDASTQEGAQARDALAQGLRDLNTVSNQSLLRNTLGPFKTIGNWLGRAGEVGGTAISAPWALPAALLDAIQGHSLAGKIGSVTGGVLDRIVGTNKPPIVLQAQRAAQALKAAGIDPGTSSQDVLMAARLAMASADPATQLAAQIGLNGLALKPSPDMSPDAALSMHPFLQQQLASSLNLTPQELQSGLRAGLTPAQVARGRDLRERAADKVSGMAYRNDQWPSPQVAEANFVNTDGATGSPNTGYSTPGYLKGNAAVGLNKQTVRVVQSAMEAAAQKTGMQKQTQASTEVHASAMASKLAQRRTIDRVLNGSSEATARPNTTGGVEALSNPTKPDTADQMDANGGSQRPLSSQPQAPTNGGFAQGWKAYVHKGLKDHGITANVADIHQAVRDLASNGSLGELLPGDTAQLGPAGVAGAIIQHHGDLRGPGGRELMRRVAVQVAHNKGALEHLDTSVGGSSGGFTSSPEMAGRPPVRDPVRWREAAASYGRTAQALGNILAGQGLHSTAALVNSFHSPNMAKLADKQEALESHLKTLPAAHRLIATRIIANAPGLMAGV